VLDPFSGSGAIAVTMRRRPVDDRRGPLDPPQTPPPAPYDPGDPLPPAASLRESVTSEDGHQELLELAHAVAKADEQWHGAAACAGVRTNSFYIAGARKHSVALCSECPASEPCLWAALALEQLEGRRFGIWGGTTPARRARIAASLSGVEFSSRYVAVVDSWASRTSRAAPLADRHAS
jgi:hypothetical protein